MDSRSDNLTVDEVAELAEVTPRTVRNWINRGLLSPITDDGRKLFDQTQVLHLQEAREESANLDVRYTLVNMKYRLARLESLVGALAKIHDLRRTSMKPSMLQLTSLSGKAMEDLVRSEELGVDQIEEWLDVLALVDDNSFVAAGSQEIQTWDLLYQLSTALERRVNKLPGFSSSLSLQKLHAEADYIRRRFRDAALIRLSSLGVPLDEMHRIRFGPDASPKEDLFLRLVRNSA